MRKLTFLVTAVAIAGSVIAVAPGLAERKPPKAGANANANAAAKTWICHRAAKKYVALRVSNKAVPHHVQHHEDITAGVPTTRQAAREFCASQQVLTPRRGGSERDATLTSGAAPGVSAKLAVRARVGQSKVCFRLSLTGATSATSLVLSKGGTEVTTTPTLTSLLGSGTTASGCAAISRELARQIVKSPTDFTATLAVATAGGPVTLTAPLSA
jgi:hypothetical protein